MSDDQPKCPVDPKTREVWLQKSKQSQAAQQRTIDAQKSTSNTLQQSNSWSWKNLIWAPTITNINHNVSNNVCPVPHAPNASISSDHPVVPGMITTSEPESIECSSDELDQTKFTPTKYTAGSEILSKDRVISSIPRTNADSNWIYPSEKQFFNAMLRKNWSPEEQDMKTVVPLHNMVNEIAWVYILNWEKGQGGDKCGGIKLTSFKGDAQKITPRAFIGHYIFGRDLPFDRHDWMINRCGTDVEYVIDFYTTPIKEGEEPKFFLDVRPKLNSFEGCRMRLYRALGL
ncbi:Cytochrome c1 heme lyase [Pichia californica]|uniref:Holocytochrome c-type synthase n=1 Tax=Pichia californica TaxID=460514 RepID=A0A9P6WNZ9_9ASCO|nr:Cytochrome c1 heme lyase [[Candida] californica]KAG0690597.1 Cytochrome c1 heme lyase [[Candida] californica]